ncbi:MAG TPA: DUF2865 domain-containing protein [Xanthobacteraceae bacterium]
MISKLRRVIAPAAVILAAAVCAHAQQLPPPQSQQAPEAPQAGQAPQGNPVCTRLEGQLSAFDRGSADNARAEQIRKYEEAAAGQQSELDRQQAQARRLNCESNSFFVLFSGGQNPQCGPLNSKISQMRGNLDRINADLDRLRGNSAAPEREGQRRAILVALAQNNCGAQYRAAVASAPPQRSGSLFESLFGPGPGSILAPSSGGGFMGGSDTYRTVCVRTCDGFFYPISFSTNASRFGEDENTCRKSCPAAEVMLFSHRNPGEDINQAVSTTGNQPYTSLPNAFKYRQAWDNSCSCRRAGENWAQTMKNVDDTTVEQGDIVVNDQRARQLSQPRFDAHGRPSRAEPAAATAPARPAPRPASATVAPVQAAPLPAAAPAATAPPADAQPAAKPEAVKPDPNRTIRAVGPTFLPAR